MSAPSTPTGLTNISILSYTVLYDISGAVPAITLTNLSTVSDYSKLKWWYVITTPSGTPIHTGSLTTPDVNGVSWTTLQIAAGEWPTPFGNPPCSQVEFAPGAPYVCTLYVHDNDVPGTPSVGLSISQVIVRPNGNTQYSCGNFGVAKVDIQTRCNDRVIFCSDGSNFAYNSILSPIAGTQTNVWTLEYPADPNGNQPANGTATNTPTVNFPIQYSGSGYVLNLRDYGTYDMDNGASIKVQYKAINKNTGAPGLPFAVLCNIDLCKLQCQIKTFYELSIKKCGNVDDPELMNKMTRMNLLLWEATIGIMQPLCGIDVPAIIAQIQSTANLPQDCNCGCTDTGINFSYPLSPGTSSGGCCPVSSDIINITSSPPTSCENTVYPVQVYDPTATTIIGIANDLNGIIYLLNTTASWMNYGTAFSEGYCKVGWVPAVAGNTIPAVYISSAATSTGCVGNQQYYVVNMVDVCFPLAPITAADFPLNAYVDFDGGTNTIFLGNVADQAALIVALNSYAAKPASVTFSAGSTASQIVIFNSDCNSFSTPIIVTCDAASTEFFSIGASHGDEASGGISGDVLGYGVRSNAIIGHTPTFPSVANIQWHTIILSSGRTYMFVTETDTGKIYMWDVSNPLMPSFVKAVQLNTVVGNNFTGIPTSRGINGAVVSSFYSLYFPTDEHSTMALTGVYVFEALTGTGWRVDMIAGTISASFQDDMLIGKCPRILRDGHLSSPSYIYFTQDGSLEGDTGQTSGVAPGDIVRLDTSDFSSTGLSTKTIIPSDEIYAASWDSNAFVIWFSSIRGWVAKLDITTDAVTVYPGVLGQIFQLRGNSSFFNNILYCSSLDPFSAGVPRGIIAIDVSVLPTITRFFFDLNTANVDSGLHVHNVLPLGNCLALVTGEGDSTPTKTGSIALYKIDGTFLNAVNLPTAKNIFNLVVFSGFRYYTPTTFVP